MWDIMAFFRGGLNGEHAHDELGKEIAVAGKEWVKQCYRWADLEAYQFRFVFPYLLRPLQFAHVCLVSTRQTAAGVRPAVHGRDSPRQ